MVATNDAHYITKEDAKMQSILLCIQTGKTIADADRMEFQTDEFYLKSTDEMYDLFAMVPEACENTNKIAEQCNFEFTFGETKLPYFKAPDGMENQEYFEKLCWEGLERRYPGEVTDALKERLSYEINVVKTMATPTTTSSSTTSSTTPKAGIFPSAPAVVLARAPGGLLRRHYRIDPILLQPHL